MDGIFSVFVHINRKESFSSSRTFSGNSHGSDVIPPFGNDPNESIFPGMYLTIESLTALALMSDKIAIWILLN